MSGIMLTGYAHALDAMVDPVAPACTCHYAEEGSDVKGTYLDRDNCIQTVAGAANSFRTYVSCNDGYTLTTTGSYSCGKGYDSTFVIQDCVKTCEWTCREGVVETSLKTGASTQTYTCTKAGGGMTLGAIESWTNYISCPDGYELVSGTKTYCDVEYPANTCVSPECLCSVTSTTLLAETYTCGDGTTWTNSTSCNKILGYELVTGTREICGVSYPENTCQQAAAVCDCADGKYGQSQGFTSFCSNCPAPGTSAKGSNCSLTDCFIPAGNTGSDETGSFEYTKDCHHDGESDGSGGGGELEPVEPGIPEIEVLG